VRAVRDCQSFTAVSVRPHQSFANPAWPQQLSYSDYQPQIDEQTNTAATSPVPGTVSQTDRTLAVAVATVFQLYRAAQQWRHQLGATQAWPSRVFLPQLHTCCMCRISCIDATERKGPNNCLDLQAQPQPTQTHPMLSPRLHAC
jgi:hypothetical protein